MVSEGRENSRGWDRETWVEIHDGNIDSETDSKAEKDLVVQE